ncbi:DEAD/DEAH box helicase [Streptomyces sp. NPDC021212]|uniref:DEAD/DEAH box helicase n=1 Tax=Streptomyces sp. NPDC021212 TaxID=3365118 RepID=UPI00378DE3E5
MTHPAGSVLKIGFDETRTKAVLRATPDCQEQLVRLTARFGSGSQRGQFAAEVDLEEFLANLMVLNTWPEPQSVRFAPDLQSLAEGSVRDAQAVEQRLKAGEQGQEVHGEVRPEDVHGRLGGDWHAPLTDFQARDVAKLLSLTHGANFSVPGAGKTRTAMAVYSALRESGHVSRLLVVSPKSAYEAWKDESALCFSEPLRIQVMEKGSDLDAEVLLVNYERLNRSLTTLANWLSAAPSLLVLDEAHRMKLGVRGTYGAACMALGPLARHRLIMTGTPAPNGAKDLESLLSFVWPGHGRRAVDRAVGGGDLVYASQVLRPLFTRTTKSELGLPPVDFRFRSVELPPEHRKLYTALTDRLADRGSVEQEQFAKLGKVLVYLMMASTSPALLAEGGTRYEPLPFYVPPLEAPEGGSLFRLMRELQRYELSPKYEAVFETVRNNAAVGRKTLVWSTFVRNLTSLERALGRFQPAIVHGGSTDREEQIQRFRHDADCMVLLSNPATLGEGISLHHVCHDAIYVDRDFAAGRFLQSLDRIHRLGLAPDTKTRITVLVAEGTIDEVVKDRLAAKLDFMGTILDDPSVRQLADPEEDEASWGMDMADIRALLSHLGSSSSSATF